MELRHASSPTLLRCLLLSSPALLLFAFFLLQLLLLDPAPAWLRSATAPPESSSICEAAAPVAAAPRRSCAEDPEWRLAVALEVECAVDRMLAERGASLLHSWSDEELFLRAGATVASHEDLLLLQQQRRDSAVVVQGEGSRNNVSEEEEPAAVESQAGDATVSQFFLQYQQSVHKERCKLYTNGLAYGRSTRLAVAAPAATAAAATGGGPDPGGDLATAEPPPPILVRPKVAFLFLTTGWLPFARLWDAFFAGHEHLLTVYVHAWPPPGANRVEIGRGAKHFWGRVVPGDAAERGDVSLIAAARRLLANALLDDPMNQHFALVSDHCVPVRGFRHVYGVLTAAGKSFVEQETQSPVMWGRYMGRGGQDLMLPEIPYSQFRKGSQFWVLIRRHALLLVKDTKYWAKFAQRCIVPGTCYPEEHYFPTVLAIEDPDGTVNYTLTAVDWSRGEGTHPTSWTKEDLTMEFITRLQTDRGGVNLFARKFDDDTVDALLALSHDLLRN